MKHVQRLTLGLVLALAGACGDDDTDTGSQPTDGDAGQDGQSAEHEPSDSGARDAAGEADASAGDDAGDAGYISATYAQDENWLCNPAAEGNRCSTRASATEIMPDDSESDIAEAEQSGGVDCFYVYPTIDLSEEPGRVEDFSNIDDIWDTARQQAEPFSDICDVYAPLYHQMTIGSYQSADRDDLLEESYAEIEDAFLHYMAQHNAGRDIVLLGHSQGSHLLRRLMQRHFDGDDGAALRDQLLLAILIGPLGDITVPPGELVGGSFEDIPLCDAAGQRGCLITYGSYPASQPPDTTYGLFVGGIEEGLEGACVNPAALAGGKAKSAGAYFPSHPIAAQADTLTDFAETRDIDTFFTVYRDFYALECLKNDAGHGYLAVSVDAAGDDQRADPILYDAPELYAALIGLHIYDFNLALEDLLAAVVAAQ